jgi:hypothetical protein
MQHAWEKEQLQTQFFLENLRKKDDPGNLGVYENKILKFMLGK